MPFYIVEPDGEYGPNIPWIIEGEASVSFSTRVKAEKAAKEYANNSPGTVFYIVEAVARVSCKVPEATIENMK